MFPTADTEDISQVTSLSRSSSSSSDARDSPERAQVSNKSNSREFTFNMLIKEIVFCLALVLTTYGALHNTPRKVSKHPQAVRFFSPQSVVTDWYRGQLSDALSYINNADISFVMYYAPWDAESQHVRDEFDKAATILHDKVHFSAINCWNPGSECRIQHSKIPSWPILMAYTINNRGVLYKGPRDAHSMVKFMELIMKPLDRISSTDDLIHLLSICDAVAVGFTPLSDTTKYYNVWYKVAIKSKEFDVIGEICFAVVTSEELAADLGVSSTPSARLMLWNDTKEFKTDGNPLLWTESSLMFWVLENFTQPVARIIPLWRKAFSFERFIDGNPILMLFTPLNPLYPQLPSYGLLREIAMEYYNCKNSNTSQWTMELMKLQQLQRQRYEQKNLDKFCQDYKFKTPVRKTNKYLTKTVVSRNNKYPWSNTTTTKNQNSGLLNFFIEGGLAISKLIESSDDQSDLLSSLGMWQCSSVLPAEKNFYENPQKCQENIEIESELEMDKVDTETSMLPFDNDPLAPGNIRQEHVKHFCKLIKFAKEFSPIVIPESHMANLTNINGLACANNFSLNMLAVDSVENHHFAESLGIDVASKKDMTAVVILDIKHESQYVLSEPYSPKSVRDFIYNFTQRTLKKYLKTHVEDALHTHYFGSDGKTEQMGINESTVHVLDLTTKTFRQVIRKGGKITIVAVCGGACGAHTTRSIAEAGRILSASGVDVQIARIDALRHDLPWHYTISKYPTLLVFTNLRGSELVSRAYPYGARITSSGVVALALRSLPSPQHLRMRLKLCTTSKVNLEKENCLRELREHVSDTIGRNLNYWRRSEDSQYKDAFFRRLQYLHQVSLVINLLHISDLIPNSQKLNSLLDSLNVLSKNWDINVYTLAKSIKAFERR